MTEFVPRCLNLVGSNKQLHGKSIDWFLYEGNTGP